MKYPEIMKALSPYMFCNVACGDIYAESLKNINKFRKRSSNTIDFGAIEVLEDQMDIEATRIGHKTDLIRRAIRLHPTSA